MIETFTIPMAAFNRDCAVQVWLPDGYAAGDELYPVMYLLDGERTFGAAGEAGDKPADIMRFMAEWDKKMIVVTIAGAAEEAQRQREYCPFPVVQRDGTELQGMGEATIQWLLHELKPVIDDRYRINPFRLCTGIAGCGMGGTLALYALAKYNNWFSKAACLSSDLKDTFHGMERVVANGYLDSNTRLFLGWGSDEHQERDALARTVGRALQLSRLFVMQECSTYPYQQRGGMCDSASWKGQIPLFMHYLWKE